MNNLKEKTRTVQAELRFQKEARRFSNLEELQLIDKKLGYCKSILLEFNKEKPNEGSIRHWFHSLELCAQQ